MRRQTPYQRLGFWIDVSDLFRAGALHDSGTPVPGGQAGPWDPGLQDLIRIQLQAIVGTLELLRENSDPGMRPFLADAHLAVQTIRGCLDIWREDAG